MLPFKEDVYQLEEGKTVSTARVNTSLLSTCSTITDRQKQLEIVCNTNLCFQMLGKSQDITMQLLSFSVNIVGTQAPHKPM